MKGFENVEELVDEFRTLLVRSSAGGVARVTILVPTVVPVKVPVKAMICLMCFSKLLFRAVHVLRMFLTVGPIVSAQDYCAIDLTINLSLIPILRVRRSTLSSYRCAP